MARIDMTIRRTVEIEVGNVYSKINGRVPELVLKKIDSSLSYFVQGYAFMKAYKSGWFDPKKQKWVRWDGRNHLFKNNKFLTGLLWRVESILKNNNVDYKIKDIRKDVPFGPPIKTKNIQKREYQERILKAAIQNKSGIIQSATGSGKSVMITSLIASTNVKTMVYVTGVDLLYQMKEGFEKMLGTKVGIIGDGIADIKRINVCTIWTASNALGGKYVPFDDEDNADKEKFNSAHGAKIAKAIRESEMNLYDECHMLATSTLQLINQNSKNARYKFGFSGTAWRDDNADMLIEAATGKIIIEVNASELIKGGFLVKPKIYFVDVPEKANMPSNYHSIYKKYIVQNLARNNKIIKNAEKLVKQGRKVLVLVKNINHGKILLSKFSPDTVVYFVRGDIKSEERNRIRKDFLNNKIDVIIASVVYDQGIDIPNLDGLILAGSGKASGRALQRIGRVIRPFKGKKDAIVIDFMDNCKYLSEHSKKRMEIYKKEAGFEVHIPKPKKKVNKKNPSNDWGKSSW